MNEKPKSILKKSWKGRSAFLGWLVLATGLAFVVSLLGIIILDPWQWRADGGIVIAGTASGAITALLFLFIRWLFCQRNLCRTLFGLACFVTLIALIYAEEDWRGKHDWEKFKREWEAKGEKFDRASAVPLPVPDDQNFALTPIVASSYETLLDKNGHALRPRNTNVVNRLQISPYGDGSLLAWPTNGDWRTARASDLNVWQQYYRALAAKTNTFPVSPQPQTPAADVLLALGKYTSTIEELRQSGQLPYSRFPLEYDKEDTWAMMFPHLAGLKGCAQVLQLRSLAELQNGQSDQALADVKLMLRLVDSIRNEPILISHLVRLAMVNIALQPVWEGLAEHKWSDAQLAQLGQELTKLDLLSDYKLAMRGEMVLCQVGFFDYLRHHPGQLQNLYSEGAPSSPASVFSLSRLIPSGWFYQNQLHCTRPMVEFYLPAADVNQGIISPAVTRRADAAVVADTQHVTPFNMIERLLLPALGSATRKFAFGQAAVDLAQVAVALERYRLAHGEYPELLDVLVPQFIAKLPHDVINGQPLHYRRDPPSPGSGAASGQFVLYSVGWNETDDGGEVGLTKKGYLDISQGDWVWRYPAK
jgi:hypothetical protein